MFNSLWYNSLNKPYLAPPNHIFKPVWIVLYILMAISLYLFLKDGFRKSKIAGFVFFVIQLILNFTWSVVFFGAQSIVGGLVIVSLLVVFIALTFAFFIKHTKIGAFLLLPYLLWVCFAFYLNLGYLIAN